MKAKDLQPGIWYKLMDGDDWLIKFIRNDKFYTYFSKGRKHKGRLVKKEYFIDVDNGPYELANMQEVIRLFPEEAINFEPEIY